MSKKEPTPRVIYYTDELGDEFSSAVITPKRIDASYRYRRDKSFFGKVACFFWYRVVALPIAYFYLKIKFRHKVIGRKKLKEAKGAGVFIYGNHTQPTADALIPTFITYPKWAYVIVHPSNVSMPYLGRITPYMGALPLPDDMAAARSFLATVKERIGKGKPVFIYPEAHIWPYFTGIRNFKDDSFVYPVRQKTPVFCFTNVYKKRRSAKRVKLITYIDGPFYPKAGVTEAEAKRILRDEVYATMCERASLSDAVLIQYLPKED